MLCPTLRPEDCERLLARLGPEPRALLTDALDWDPAPLREVPATSIQTTRDRVIRPKDQPRMARSGAGVGVVPLPAGHADPVPHPERLADLLLQDT